MGLQSTQSPQQHLPQWLLNEVGKLVAGVDRVYHPAIYRTASDVRRGSLSLETERRPYDRLLQVRGLDSADPDVATAIMLTIGRAAMDPYWYADATGATGATGTATGATGAARPAHRVNRNDGSEPQGQGYVNQDGPGPDW
jgi:hypothetical protein